MPAASAEKQGVDAESRRNAKGRRDLRTTETSLHGLLSKKTNHPVGFNWDHPQEIRKPRRVNVLQ